MLSQALQIICRMAQGGHLDLKLVQLFIRERVYLQYAERYLHPSQIDAVDDDPVYDCSPTEE
ncbi:MAG: hypothetical protein B0D83_01070 [Candidatus Sedimenticola endophacoides]|nr:MAG: hypothetical protein B0D83_01070 [Candidatus Sedimenticola endophacoides]